MMAVPRFDRMPDELTFGEIAQLERRLVEMGRRVGDVDAAVHDIVDWLATLSPSTKSRLDADALASLASSARSVSDPRSRLLALGALVLVKNDASTHPERSRFTARFAVQRLASLAGEAPLWKRVRVSSADEVLAREFFEAARGDTSYADDELVDAATTFVAAHRATSGMYGRLAADLEFLVRVLHDPVAGAGDRETARAALTYFIVNGDAIPDDLGPVGLVDDALVVQNAVAAIHPERGAVTSVLDQVVARWPFVEEIVLESLGRPYPASEFVVVNTALLLDEVLAEGATGAAIVVPASGPLPLLCGFLRALAELRDDLADVELPTFLAGERLQNRASHAEVEFVRYGCLDASGAIRPTSRENATHFEVRTGERQYRRQPLSDLLAFTRSTKHGGKLGKGNVAFDHLSMAMGPLERLFGRTTPVVLPAQRRRVIVVMDRPEAKALASGLSLFGWSLHDVVPMSSARLGRDGFSEDTWTADGPGGAPYLTVVTSGAEALELVDDETFPVAGVVARIRSGTTDATNIADVYRRGVRVVAIVAPSDHDTHAMLEAAGMRFFTWDEAWFGALHWPVPSPDHAVGNHESWLRTLDRSEVHARSLSLPELDEGWSGLKALERSLRTEADDDDMLSSFIGAAVSLVQLIRTTVVPPDANFAQQLKRRRAHVDAALRSGAHWWSAEVASAAERSAAALGSAAARLTGGGAKWDALRIWFEANPDGTVICGPSLGARLTEALAPVRISWTPDSRVSGLAAGLVPFWSSGDRMDRLLHPPVASRLELLLYGPECEWFEAAKRRRTRVVRQLEQVVARASPFRGLLPRPRREAGKSEVLENTASASVPELDEMASRSRRTQLLRRIRDESSETALARLVHFAGGAWAAFSRESHVHTITHLLGETNAVRRELRETQAWELEPGDVVVLIRGSDRDVIRAVVDDFAPAGLRELAGAWRRALCRYAETRDLDDIVARLSDAGCKRTRSTVARWLTDDTMIRLRHNRADIEAIARVTGDTELENCLDHCVDACDELFTLHAVVGRDLTDKVLDTARDWIAVGIAPDEVVDVDARLAVAAVESVDAETVAVPRGLVGRLQDV